MKSTTLLGLAATIFASGVLAAPTARATSSYPTTNGVEFTIDGTTKHFAGTNGYWIPFLTSDTDVDTAMDQIEASGLKILRVWGFNDVNTEPTDGSVWFQSFVSGKDPVINTGSDGLQRLDYVVSAAESRGIKLIINFVNNWTDYGGMAAYLNYYGGSANSEWYDNTSIQAQYQKYIEAVVSRYSDSSAIFAWELANEARCNGCDTSVIYDWASATSKYIKQLDSNHMVTLGDEGFGLSGGDGSYPYTYDEGVDFEKNLEIETLDFGTLHLYPSGWGQSNEPFGSDWIEAHGKACASANKPCLVEEYGVSSDKCSVEGNWQTVALDTSGVGADLFWDFGTTLSSGQTADDGYTIFYQSSDWTCLVVDHQTAIG